MGCIELITYNFQVEVHETWKAHFGYVSDVVCAANGDKVRDEKVNQKVNEKEMRNDLKMEHRRIKGDSFELFC